jgi:hypothetical protein
MLQQGPCSCGRGDEDRARSDEHREPHNIGRRIEEATDGSGRGVGKRVKSEIGGDDGNQAACQQCRGVEEPRGVVLQRTEREDHRREPERRKTGDIVATKTGGDEIQPDIAEQEAGIASNEGPRHPWAKSLRDGHVVGERAERKIGDDCRGADGDLHCEDRVVALGMRDHGNGEYRAQAQRHPHSKLPDDPFGAPLRVGEQRLHSLIHALNARECARLIV